MTDVDLHLDQPVRDAATVMLLRDGADGLEVLMMRRTPKAAFAPDAHVFPGGALDPVDVALGDVLCEGRSDDDASRRAGVPAGGLAYWVAAVRECFEEAGVLVASERDERGAAVAHDPVALAEARAVVLRDGATAFGDWCRAQPFAVQAGDMHLVARWITPLTMPRRFDTRFLVARAPDGQEALHDDGEAVETAWIRPADALARGERGEIVLIPPTVASLTYLSRFGASDDALADAATIGPPAPIEPRPVIRHGRVTGMLLPGDPGYDELAPPRLGR
jgi:8-oxo-dGTP pyrophosphatase MutT (NUDIX family)